MALKNIPTLPHKADIDVVNDRVLVSVSDDDEPLDKNKGKLTSPQEMYRELDVRYSFGGLSVDDCEDDAAKQTAVAAAAILKSQDTLRIGKGEWPLDAIEIVPFTKLMGAGAKSTEEHGGTVLTLKAGATSILKTKQVLDGDGNPTIAVRDITIQDLTLDIGSETAANAFLHDMTFATGSGQPTNDILFKNVTFIGSGAASLPLAHFKAGDGQSPYCEGIKFENCRMIVPANTRGLQWDTVNGLLLIEQLHGIGDSGCTFIYGKEMGLLQMDLSVFEYPQGTPSPDVTTDRTDSGRANLTSGSPNLTFTGEFDGSNNPLSLADVGHPITGTGIPADTYIKSIGVAGFSAVLSNNATSNVSNGNVTIKRYTRSTDMPFAAIHLVGNRDTILINSCADESIQNFLVVEGPYYPTIDLNACFIQSPIRCLESEGDGLLKLNVRGGNFPHGTLNAEANTQVELNADGVGLKKTSMFGTVVDDPTFEGIIDPDCAYRNPKSFFVDGETSANVPISTYGEPTRVLESATLDPDASRATFLVGNPHSSNITDSIFPIFEIAPIDPITKKPFFGMRYWRDADTGLYHSRGRQEGSRGEVIHDAFAVMGITPLDANTAGVVSIDCIAGNTFTLTPTGHCRMTAIHPIEGQLPTLRILTSGTDSFMVSFDDNYVVDGPIWTGEVDEAYLEIGFKCEGTKLVEQYRKGPIYQFAPDQVSGLNLWAEINSATNPDSVTDLSGDSNTLVPTSGTGPAHNNLGDGIWELRWDGTTTYKPLKTPNGDHSITHFFCAASVDEATFSDYKGLASAVSTIPMLVGNSGGTTWFNNAISTTYKMGGVTYAESAANAPMNDIVEVISVKWPGATTLTGGLLIASDRLISGRILNGSMRGCILTYNNGSMTADDETRIRQYVARQAIVGTE